MEVFVHYIAPLPKSPHSAGRIGPRTWQDWYRAVVRSVRLLRTTPDARILIATATHIAGAPPERELYLEALYELGVADKEIVVLDEGRESVGHLEAIHAYAHDRCAEVTVVSTLFHYPRVRWIARPFAMYHRCVLWAIPRPSEMFTDIGFAIIFPLIDLIGKRAWFLDLVNAHRASGKL